MRIGLVIYDDLETISGGYLYDRKLVDYLRSQGDTVDVISIPYRNYALHLADNFSPDLKSRLEDGQFDVLLQDEFNHPSLFRLNHTFLHGVFSPDIAASNHPRPKGKIARFPVISIVHHLRSCENFPAWQNRIHKSIERRYLTSVDGFIFNSQTTKNEVIDTGVNLDRRPSIIASPAGDNLKPDISDSEIIKRASMSGPLRLVFLGNLIPRKGLITLLKTLEAVPADLYRLDIVGSLALDRNYTARVRSQINNGGMTGSVTIHDYVDDHQLAGILQSCHLMVVPSIYEGFGIIYIEGMGFGLPAIGTTVGGASEIITHGSDGYLIRPRDTRTLKRLILELANDRGRLIEMSLAARRRYLDHPTWSSTCENIRAFLLRISATEKKNYDRTSKKLSLDQ